MERLTYKGKRYFVASVGTWSFVFRSYWMRNTFGITADALSAGRAAGVQASFEDWDNLFIDGPYFFQWQARGAMKKLAAAEMVPEGGEVVGLVEDSAPEEAGEFSGRASDDETGEAGPGEERENDLGNTEEEAGEDAVAEDEGWAYYDDGWDAPGVSDEDVREAGRDANANADAADVVADGEPGGASGDNVAENLDDEVVCELGEDDAGDKGDGDGETCDSDGRVAAYDDTIEQADDLSADVTMAMDPLPDPAEADDLSADVTVAMNPLPDPADDLSAGVTVAMDPLPDQAGVVGDPDEITPIGRHGVARSRD